MSLTAAQLDELEAKIRPSYVDTSKVFVPVGTLRELLALGRRELAAANGPLQVGDRVRVLAIGGVAPDGIVGQLATVTSVTNQKYLHAVLDEPPPHGALWAFHARQLERLL